MTVVVITGASSGLGAALAKQYANNNTRLYLCGRHAQRLEAVAQTCRGKGADVKTALFDISNLDHLEKWAVEIEKEGVPDLLIANAGIFHGHAQDEMESPDEIKQQINTNLLGTINTVNAFIPLFKKHRKGHIVLVSSLAAIFPLADAPSYSASKAAILAYAKAMREYLGDFHVKLSVVMPGHIDTPQTDKHRGRLSGIISAETAAQKIVAEVEKGGFVIAFPKTGYWLIRLSALLPWRLVARLNRGQRFHVE